MIDLCNNAIKLRREILKTCFNGRAGHIPPSLSSLDLLNALYFGEILHYNPQNPLESSRDRFVLSKGHAALAIYNILCDAGFFSRNELDTFCKPGTIFGAHPTTKIPGIEASTGALGHGLPFSVGLAIAAKKKNEDHLIYCLTGDGECQEGSIWEAAMSIGNFRLNNLIWIIDHNGWQATGKVSETMEIDPLDEKLRAFGLDPIIIKGHDYNEIIPALTINRASLPNKPRVVIAKTIKGKGIEMIENKREWHSKIPSMEEFAVMYKQLGLTEKEFIAI